MFLLRYNTKVLNWTLVGHTTPKSLTGLFSGNLLIPPRSPSTACPREKALSPSCASCARRAAKSAFSISSSSPTPSIPSGFLAAKSGTAAAGWLWSTRRSTGWPSSSAGTEQSSFSESEHDHIKYRHITAARCKTQKGSLTFYLSADLQYPPAWKRKMSVGMPIATQPEKNTPPTIGPTLGDHHVSSQCHGE